MEPTAGSLINLTKNFYILLARDLPKALARTAEPAPTWGVGEGGGGMTGI